MDTWLYYYFLYRKQGKTPVECAIKARQWVVWWQSPERGRGRAPL